MKTRTIVTIAMVWLSFCSPVLAQWKQTSLDSVSVTCFAVSGADIFVGADSGVFRSTDQGTTWSAVNAGLTNTTVGSFAVSGANLFAGTNGGVFRSTNNGTSWTAVNAGLTDTTHVMALVVSPNWVDGTKLFAGTINDGVFISTNNGTNWGAVNAGLPHSSQDTAAYIPVTAFAVSPNGSGGTNLFAGIGEAPGGNSVGGVFLSTNNGTSWTARGLTNAIVYSFALSGTNLFAGATSYLGGSHGSWVSLSTNSGSSWTGYNPELGRSIVSALATSPNGRGDTNLFAGTYLRGVFISTNNGASWAAVNTGLADTLVNALAVSGTNLFAGTHSGVWRRPMSEMITSVQQNNDASVPRVFALEQNYPNPFNPTTIINFQLPIDNHVTLKVYDVLGKEVRTLVNEEMKAGSYTTTFDATGLASGVYYYRIQAGEFVQTKKLTILK